MTTYELIEVFDVPTNDGSGEWLHCRILLDTKVAGRIRECLVNGKKYVWDPHSGWLDIVVEQEFTDCLGVTSWRKLDGDLKRHALFNYVMHCVVCRAGINRTVYKES